MRCYFKSVVWTVVGVAVLTSIYIYCRRVQLTESMELRRTQYQYSSVSRNSSNESCSQDVVKNPVCLSASVRLLAGIIPKTQGYLTVGLSSVKRKKENYLMTTLRSIFTQSSEDELSQMVVVVLLADFDVSWVQETVTSIEEQFSTRLSQGQLLVIHADQDLYPPLTGLKRNFNDAPDRVTFRSKQNVDYAFLVDFSAGLSQYYLMLEDDVTCSKGFLTSIRGHVQSQGSSQWVTLEFSKLGYIGKLYNSKDLSRLAQFLYLFYQEMPCDFLLSHFRTLLMQDKVIRFRPSLFQHMGLYSSFRGTHNKLKDEDFQHDPADNPPADVYTDIEVFEKHAPDNAYSQGTSFFWGKSPIYAGNYFLIAFHRPVVPSRILIQTGLDGKDLLKSADVVVGEIVLKTGSGVECTKNHSMGSLKEGQFEQLNVQETLKQPVLCLKITVTDKQEDWVIVRNIQVWIDKEKKKD
ncbi:alpha-1,3-mannosyl-glycoprotein 4-beta-N-acetylglucosaminyltransferase C [Astyanax mexicanus]|uniref:alpha-1,3-mannosyl-glycoprotein 4-beta-N-acetylglucosaminyltransferase C n=1 Tax=Astyanax mexicanus TaxID=7994 RepID=UPI0020CADD3A|nr:alpha-1,3-mannosyl-glycoprotein 4-beta-N-acetylglucosaminyltransferase C [Astyanax mexicanus]XP_022518051.2 alpha-1,3-mannosyl-glycoprotein 4-beta-N-acetylglucosaminyltransferase C [Astyanax mexicanus]XP_049342463.1 alpha-1,3-mannosyl-glycoprotein 4-beta-N-acetylglucosaminyltransferase C [Astyanax mexicanus]